MAKSFYAHKVIRALTKSCAAQEIGLDGVGFVSIIAMQEDTIGYREPAKWYREQLMAIAGISSTKTFDRIRKNVEGAGWLKYTAGRKRCPGRFSAQIPKEYQDYASHVCSENAPHSDIVGNIYPESYPESDLESALKPTHKAPTKGCTNGDASIPKPTPKPKPNIYTAELEEAWKTISKIAPKGRSDKHKSQLAWKACSKVHSSSDIIGAYMFKASTMSDQQYVPGFQSWAKPANVQDWIDQGRPGSTPEQSAAVEDTRTPAEIKQALLDRRRKECSTQAT